MALDEGDFYVTLREAKRSAAGVRKTDGVVGVLV